MRYPSRKLTFSLLFLSLYAGAVVFATPPGSQYTPGETLDPTCAPGDTNCSVEIAAFEGWGLAGNAGTTAGTNFIGTSDNIDVVIGRNGIQIARFYSDRLSMGLNVGNAENSNFIGDHAGAGVLNSTSSNFIGSSAGQGATDAADSNFIGNSAGYEAINSGNSNFFGPFAGYLATNASYSNLFGYYAGTTFTGNNIGSNNIIIGTNISLPNATANAINLGGVLFGTGTYATTTGDPSITPVSGGRIGIGVVSPAATLDINGDTIISGSSRYLNFGTTSGTSGYGFRDNSGTMQWKNSAGSWANIASGGVSDGDKTDITVSASGATWTIDNTAVTYAKIQNVAANSFLANLTGSSASLTAVATNRIPLFGSAITGTPSSSTYLRGDGTWETPAGGGGGWGLTGNASTNPTTNFIGTTDNQSFIVRTNNTQRLRIDSNGRVGVGSGIPGYNLDVGQTTSSANLYLNVIDAYGTLVDATFNIGGFSGPENTPIGYQVSISSTSPDTVSWIDDQSNGGTFAIVAGFPHPLSYGVTITFANNTGHGGDEQWVAYVENSVLYTSTGGVINAANEYRIAGNLFATQNRNNSLFLGKDVFTDQLSQNSFFVGNKAGFNSSNTSSSNFFGYQAGYNAGASNSNFFGENSGYQASNAPSSNFFGQNAGYQATNASSSNFFGPDAGHGATGAFASNFFGIRAGQGATGAFGSNFFGQDAGNAATNATYSNFLGYKAGEAATNGYDSNFFGDLAGYQATNAFYSNFIGDSAGSRASAANSSNFFGVGAGTDATNAAYSNFLGQSAGNAATNASYSNFFGIYAGLGATGASKSNFFGENAGQNATNAPFSNFFGNFAGNGATSATYSNFLGANTGASATNASNSNFLGRNAGQGATGASYSNLLGYQAGYTFSSNNIGSNNIIIGTNISLPNATANAINIGGVLFGTGTYATTTGNPSITPVSGGRIGIGVVSPSYTLQVGNSGVSGIVARFQNSTGTCDINPTTTSLVCSSDETLKSNITSLDSSLTSLGALRPVTYSWNASAGSAQDIQVGFIAQEVESIFPNLVFTDPTTGLKSLAYTNLIPYTVKAIQDINLSLITLEDMETPNLFRDAIVRLLESATNGLQKIFVKELNSEKVQTQELCLDDVCVTKEQLQYLLQALPPATPEEPSAAQDYNPPAEESSLEEIAPELEIPMEETILEPETQETEPIA
jgi:hypothetical protein